MMYRTELVEGITVENVTEKINAKIEEMEKNMVNLLTFKRLFGEPKELYWFSKKG